LQSFFSTTFVDEGRLFIDGKMVRDFKADGITNLDLDGAFTPGSTHEAVVEIRGKGPLTGGRGRAWLSFVPAPQTVLDLAGEWQATRDCLRYDRTMTLPGKWDAKGARRTVVVPTDQSGRTVVLHAEGRTLGVIINGKWLRRHYHLIGNRLDLNITPYVRPGAENEIELIGDGKYDLTAVKLHFYDREVYP
jgi:hypothetical protein